jgi:1-acyl-sn-glycerol-3-phosphate acyltransferase
MLRVFHGLFCIASAPDSAPPTLRVASWHQSKAPATTRRLNNRPPDDPARREASPSRHRGAWSGRVGWAVIPPLVRGVGRLAWRLEISLTATPPPPPFVVAANHHSFLDPFLVAAALPARFRFLALKELFGNHGMVDFALQAFDSIPVSRGVVPLGPVRSALRHLESGGAVGLFPEGTRHWVFDPRNARDGAAWLATRAGVPVVPIAISGTERVLGVDNKLRRGTIHLEVGAPLRPTGHDRSAVADLTCRWGAWVEQRLSARASDEIV